jgi:hypothetical protein
MLPCAKTSLPLSGALCEVAFVSSLTKKKLPAYVPALREVHGVLICAAVLIRSHVLGVKHELLRFLRMKF